MSKYGVKIKNYEAGSIYEVMTGVRNNYDSQNAMFTNSLFYDFITKNGMNIYKESSTRDIICIDFNYGSRSYEQEVSQLRKKYESEEDESKKEKLSYYIEQAELNKDKFDKKTADELREKFYKEGVDIRYPTFDKNKQISGYQIIHYKMLYRTPGKAKRGSCMFIRNSLYKKSHEFLWMGLKLPKHNAPIVEIGAYSSLITSTIEDRIQINPEDIFIMKDVDSVFSTKVVSIELDEGKNCVAVHKDDYELKNTMFDGQALIDSSIFPSWADGYILLREHFCKMAAFCTNIQDFFRDYYGDNYDTAELTDMFGVAHKVKDIKLITTDNAVKWLKFGVTYEYWCNWVHKNNDMFGIVKTAHPSKLGDVQRMSYQMVNSLSEDIMEDVLRVSNDYISQLKTDINVFMDYLEKNKNFSTDYEVLIALYKHNPKFEQSDYFRTRKNEIIKGYIKKLKTGKVIQNADNLVIIGSPYAMLLHSVGEDVANDPTFTAEDETQCWTSRFEDGEYLAEFRSPFNSRNNLGCLHNHYHEYFDKYFKLGKLCIAVNMLNTDFQDRNNGSDQDSDTIYVTNQKQIVEHAKYCHENYTTIVNNIPMDSNHYDNTMEDFAVIDNKLSAAQRDIGESSNLAQICLTYSYNNIDNRCDDYVCILSVLAQVAIDRAKRNFDVDIQKEIVRIRNNICIKDNGYPSFWKLIRPDFNVNAINKHLKCPMNDVGKISIKSYRPSTPTIPFVDFFVKHEFAGSKKMAKKVQHMIEKYSIDLYNYNTDNDDDIDNLVLRSDFEDLVDEIKMLTLSDKYLPMVSWLINRAFFATPQSAGSKDATISNLHKNRSLLLKVLYDVSPKTFIKCFVGVHQESADLDFFS